MAKIRNSKASSQFSFKSKEHHHHHHCSVETFLHRLNNHTAILKVTKVKYKIYRLNKSAIF